MTASVFGALDVGLLDTDLMAELREEIVLVERELEAQVQSSVALVSDVGRLTLRAGGKRLRPAFVALAAKAAGGDFCRQRAARIGACMEMIHMATLIHDDVIDNAQTRRGRPTASSAHGNTASILSGDVLLAKAMVLLAEDGDLAIIRTVSKAVVDMAEGEVRELELRGCFDLDEAAYFHVLGLKTASFIGGCCEAGAILAAASPEARQGLRTYGCHIGMAFQIIDDILDYRGDHAATGKSVATDFREGQATLPLIHLRASLASHEVPSVRAHFGNGASDQELREICELMQTRGAYRKSEERARQHVELAREALEGIPTGPAKTLLNAVGDFVLMRQA